MKELDAEARDQDWINFAATLSSKELARLDDENIEYRVSIPGAQ